MLKMFVITDEDGDVHCVAAPNQSEADDFVRAHIVIGLGDEFSVREVDGTEWLTVGVAEDCSFINGEWLLDNPADYPDGFNVDDSGVPAVTATVKDWLRTCSGTCLVSSTLD